ncbi:hypothetical protein DFH07DRAFT_939972 [Mycena maculata]|uniref:Uncharacterized protein n=1 Tax=Mycena maculata TaxID=230809 RepID=A0AAD7J9L4_9AGAR|nr:hypothetical protein DFH07DRAFT_939972 [Mycena maculata]
MSHRRGPIWSGFELEQVLSGLNFEPVLTRNTMGTKMHEAFHPSNRAPTVAPQSASASNFFDNGAKNCVDKSRRRLQPLRIDAAASSSDGVRRDGSDGGRRGVERGAGTGRSADTERLHTAGVKAGTPASSRKSRPHTARGRVRSSRPSPASLPDRHVLYPCASRPPCQAPHPPWKPPPAQDDERDARYTREKVAHADTRRARGSRKQQYAVSADPGPSAPSLFSTDRRRSSANTGMSLRPMQIGGSGAASIIDAGGARSRKSTFPSEALGWASAAGGARRSQSTDPGATMGRRKTRAGPRSQREDTSAGRTRPRAVVGTRDTRGGVDNARIGCVGASLCGCGNRAPQTDPRVQALVHGERRGPSDELLARKREPVVGVELAIPDEQLGGEKDTCSEGDGLHPHGVGCESCRHKREGSKRDSGCVRYIQSV